MTLTATTQLTLAQIHFNPADRNVHRDLADPTNMHRTVMILIDTRDGNEQARHDANLLYRIERNPTGTTLLVQTTAPLHLDRLPDDYATAATARDATPVLDWITTGRTIRYRIHANPHTTTRDPKKLQAEADRRAEAAIRAGKTFAAATRIRDEFLAHAARQASKRRGVRIPLTADHATQWWARTATTNGLTTDLITDTELPRITATRTTSPNTTLSARAFDGIATITNPDAVRTAVTRGIGQGRSYGLGLLSLAPHHE